MEMDIWNTYEPIKNTVTVELGEEISQSPEDYIQSGNKTAVKETKLDMEKVVVEKTGTYDVEASYKDKSAKFQIKIVDTTKPELTLTEAAKGYKVIVGKEKKASELIKSVEDLSGIEKLSFGEGYTKEVSDKKGIELLEQYSFVFPEVGEQKITISAVDNNKNVAEETITVKVVEDYINHVSGFMDRNVVKGTADVDWMDGITWDDKIKSVTADASGVDVNTVGEYTVKYNILGDDNETIVVKENKVRVTEPYGMPVSSAGGYAGNRNNSGGTGASGGNSGGSGGYSYSAGGSGNSGSSGGSSSGGSSGGSGNGSGGSGHQPGQSWEGNKTDEGDIDYNGNTGESGTWNPF